MCNKLHADHKKIKKSGYAWKLFRKSEKVLICVFGGYKYRKAKSGWITWEDDLYNAFRGNLYVGSVETGFCAFRVRKEARRALRDLKLRSYNDTVVRYNDTVIRKIEYRDGLGCHDEKKMLTNKCYEIIIVKKFKLWSKRNT